ncbi:MAG: Ig domain-containing protein [Candidatus Falkowbacteria bacterium GW2011_GWC2_38_22]|uniref:Ig domain-containing protein n=1 Tax=Candidatus Falkowbacteria bacterium GW2011_GWE1_38_31 TaxID=1618638 RepID=A0A0G0MZM3_9BACT|nr:MAG: Ig domain-containing protein [Candidatus Falkowbacteria bacterium GW2011_GWF2_38_1205]KKQ61565.1 MAG: Ig domain-containing protein [Candidatus Falkowbacteria bacterium GW2011_GWC2_38_22]KKQ63542.1 MAG: Ig domain-containing protein [Candidatus Falkowbacteria bacterium GW2011_GWF1_38_22]KKQ65694.1 MAG: Ig domain-containing protein [Candidatus Falkowbacteria bacterium GW2011_GWE2_38_254]KKQ70311.1 MAG: Ig domain-containing protein [Candidatus Falkowbacteria bacterium GW2011_GWE1_38_31]KKQ
MLENNNEQESNQMVENQNVHIFNGLDKSRKIALAVLAVFAFIVIIYGIAGLRSGIYAPFTPKTIVKNNMDTNTCADGNCNDLSIEQLKNKDTDKDGLSDYDELYIYKTSPYLEDSDSDGFLDKEEINNSKDPNCPTGLECSGNVFLNEDADLTNPGTANNIDLEELKALNEEKMIGSTTETGINPLEMDAATLRQMLIDAGMEKTMLDQISDKDLLETFQESLSENGA